MTGFAIKPRDEQIDAALRGDVHIPPERLLRRATCLKCGAEFRVAACWTAVKCGACGTVHTIGEQGVK